MGVIFQVDVVYVEALVCMMVYLGLNEGGGEEGGREWKNFSLQEPVPKTIKQ